MLKEAYYEKRKKRKRYDYSFSPQLPQNFVPGGFLVPHLAQLISDGAVIGCPQLPQNFMLAGTSALQ
jgi:hypothetical protein